MRQKSPANGNRGASTRSPGRPRSEEARIAILRSTLKLLGENGFSDLTIEDVAAHASVGKATVYRWWPNKAALIADAMNGNPLDAHSDPLKLVATEDKRPARSVPNLTNIERKLFV